ncbi:hypothetical protein ACHAWF_013460 [Thalassiosira exigua]
MLFFHYCNRDLKKYTWVKLTLCFNKLRLSHHRRGGRALVLPVGGELAGGAVVPREAVDAALDEDQAELRVLVLAVALQMLPDLDGLLDEHVQVLGDLGGEPVRLEDAHDLLPGDVVDLGDSVGVAQDDADLGGGEALLGELADLLLDVGGGELAPAGGSALVGAGTLGDALSGCVHASHAARRGGQNSMQQIRNMERNRSLAVVHSGTKPTLNGQSFGSEASGGWASQHQILQRMDASTSSSRPPTRSCATEGHHRRVDFTSV